MSGDQATAIDAEADGDTIFEAPALLKVLWADPQNMSEHLALWSLKYFGPRAATATDKRRSADPEAPVEELERKAIEHQTRVSMTEGAFVGGRPSRCDGARCRWARRPRRSMPSGRARRRA